MDAPNPPSLPTAAARRAQAARQRAAQRARQRTLYSRFGGLTHFDPREQWAIFRFVLRWVVLGGLAGVLAGIASAVFLISLQWATATRTANGWLVLLLPVAGLAVGWVYQRYAGTAARGNNLVVEEVNTNHASIPLRMAPLVLAGTVVTHLFGGSAGREGTAIQMGASLADGLRQVLRLDREDRRLMLMAGISGGFGSVFGTPLAGFVFGLEVQRVGRVRYEGVVPCLAAAVVGDLVTRGLGAPHSHYPPLAAGNADGLLALKVAAAGLLFGLASLLFIELTHTIKNLARRLIPQAALRPAAGGVVIILLALIFGSDYLGLSLPLIGQALDGTGVVTFAFLLKLVFTAVTLGTGFLGGEVTPLFVIGSTLGYTLSFLLGVEPSWLASIGFVAVFAGASNTPLASLLMGVELFGGASAPYLAIGCFVAYLASGHRSIYVTQVLNAGKAASLTFTPDSSLETLASGQPGWLGQHFGWGTGVFDRPVRRLMSVSPFAVGAETPLREAVEQAVTGGVRTLPVVDTEQRVIGIISELDLQRRAGIPWRLGLLAALPAEERAVLLGESTARARDVMSAPAVVIRETATLGQAAALLVTHGLKRIPVVRADGRLSGMLTRSDVLRELEAEGDPLPGWQTPVTAFMRPSLPTLRQNATLADALHLMRDSGEPRVLISDAAGRAVGLVTDIDLMAAAAPGERLAMVRQLGGQANDDSPAILQTPLSAWTSRALVTLAANASAGDALRLLLSHQIKRLPIVDSSGQAMGWVGRTEVLRALAKAALPPETAASAADTNRP
jgi:H+/Cl- antiporter ClcA/CBS-domain-containing membrane protein